MKNLVYHLPVGLLVAYLSLCAYRPPQISDSLIIISIAALYGFLMYIKAFKELPQIEEPEEIQKIKAQIVQLKYQRDLDALNLDLARVNSNGTKQEGANKSTFRF